METLDKKTTEAVRKLVVKAHAAGKPLKVSAAEIKTHTATEPHGYLETVADPKPPKKAPKTPATFVQITGKGREWLLDSMTPKAALESLRETVAHQLEAIQATPPEFHEIATKIEHLQNELHALADRRKGEVEKLTHTVTEIKTVVDRATEETKKLFAVAPAVETPTPAAATEVHSTQPLEDAIVKFVGEWWADKSRACGIDEIKNHLDHHGHQVTIGALHDALRKLHHSETLRLGSWDKTLSEIPVGELAIFISNKVMYYVYTNDRSN